MESKTKNRTLVHKKTKKKEKNPIDNISAMEMIDDESFESGHNIFSNSEIPSFSSSSSSSPSSDLKNKFKKKKNDPVKKDYQMEKTTINSNFVLANHDKNCNLYSRDGSTSARTNSKQNLRMMELHDRSNTSKMTLDAVSNQTCSCMTMNTKQNFYNLAGDSQFPDSYNDINSLSEHQINSIIQEKMKMLDFFNDQISKKKNSIEYRYFK